MPMQLPQDDEFVNVINVISRYVAAHSNTVVVHAIPIDSLGERPPEVTAGEICIGPNCGKSADYAVTVAQSVDEGITFICEQHKLWFSQKIHTDNADAILAAVFKTAKGHVDEMIRKAVLRTGGFQPPHHDRKKHDK